MISNNEERNCRQIVVKVIPRKDLSKRKSAFFNYLIGLRKVTMQKLNSFSVKLLLLEVECLRTMKSLKNIFKEQPD